jgi:3D (Asp-Asp-Asp) domain-containing protein
MANWTWFGNAITGQYAATAARRVDWVTDTLKCALTTSGYVPNQDTHTFFSDVTNEVVGTQYTAGGTTLSGKSVSYDAASNETRLIAANPSWGSAGSPATITARKAVIYKDTGSAATSPLLGYIDFGADEVVSGGIFSINLDQVSGALKIAVT